MYWKSLICVNFFHMISISWFCERRSDWMIIGCQPHNHIAITGIWNWNHFWPATHFYSTNLNVDLNLILTIINFSLFKKKKKKEHHEMFPHYTLSNDFSSMWDPPWFSFNGKIMKLCCGVTIALATLQYEGVTNLCLLNSVVAACSASLSEVRLFALAL